MRSCLLILATVSVLTSSVLADDKVPLPPLEPEVENKLNSWLNKHSSTPEEYIVAKFANRDIVFIGEFHRIRHDPILVQNVIPLLYENGIYNLGLEFICARDQASVDSLLSASSYNQAEANRVFWNGWPFWGYQEYVDILKAAWLLNHQLPEGSRLFRVIGLDAFSDWSGVWKPEDKQAPDFREQVYPEGDRDEMMANVIKREILANGGKALIYSGSNHAFTRFQYAAVDAITGEIIERRSKRMGHRIYREIADRCFFIFLHAPWDAAIGSPDRLVYPADGVIDALFQNRLPEERRCGFDVVGSPFGRLPGKTSYWSHSSEKFNLEMFCDGWIYQMPISEYEGVIVIPDWFNEANHEEAIAQIMNPDPRVKNRDRSVEDLVKILSRSADIKRRFAKFH
ncbi:MAG: hypothetical protein JSW58_11215 [Candidatus Latescibacterota bacterium]|nr:MAG: hypothetical protein JSW58_11215 [Candidatus Latescibacterota bacterium]